MLESQKTTSTVQKISHDLLPKIIIYIAFGYLMWTKHIEMIYISDDYVVASMVGGYTLWDYLKYLFYFNGRVMTDLFANFWYRYDMYYWKVFDTCIYILAAMLFTRIFTKNKWYHAFMTCALISYFPMSYLSSAGYVACSTNYFYPVVCILLILLPIKFLMEGKKVPVLTYPFTLLGIVYATNHDQSAIALLVGLLFFIAYHYIKKSDKKLVHYSLVVFILSAIMYVIYFLLPGHLGRMTGGSISELYWLPEFANWTLFDKIYHGYTTTVSNLFYCDVFIFTIFSIILAVASLRQREPWKMFIGVFPFAGILISHNMGSTQFIYCPVYTYGMPEIMLPELFVFPLILSVVMVISIFVGVWFNVKNERNRLFVILL